MNEISLLIGLLGIIFGFFGLFFGYYSLFVSKHGMKKTEEIANSKNTFIFTILKNVLNHIGDASVQEIEDKNIVLEKEISGRFFNSKNSHTRELKVTLCPFLTIPFIKLIYKGVILSSLLIPISYLLYKTIVHYQDGGGNTPLVTILASVTISVLLSGLGVVKYLFGDGLFEPAVLTFKNNTVTITPFITHSADYPKNYNVIDLNKDIKFITANVKLYRTNKVRMKGVAINIEGKIYNITSAPLFIFKYLDCIDLPSIKETLNKELELSRKSFATTYPEESNSKTENIEKA